MYIIATIGPKSFHKDVIKGFIENGVNVLRLNCSHFSKDEFLKVIKYAREIKKDIHIMGDLCGKKIRVSDCLQDVYRIYSGEIVYFCGEDFYSSININTLKDMKLIPLTLKSDDFISNNIKSISMKDNTMTFKIIEKKQGVIKAKVIRGGVVRGGKGCNIPSLNNKNIILTSRDKEYIDWMIENKIDIICQSYVESEKEIKIVKDYIKESGASLGDIDIWAKVETPRGINSIEEFINEVSTIVIGRGDLIPESGIKESVVLENKCIEIANKFNKKVIIATHLLNSLKGGELPKITELESIYGFVNNGVGGFLLAGETSIGKEPVKTVKYMKEILEYYKGLI